MIGVLFFVRGVEGFGDVEDVGVEGVEDVGSKISVHVYSSLLLISSNKISVLLI